MKVVIAPDKFKGSCPAVAVAAAIARGWLGVFPRDGIALVPVADGGEGTLEALHAARGGSFRTVRARGPLGKEVDARWLLLEDGTAAVEMAQASGLQLVEPRMRDVRRADTFGTGQLVLDALGAGCRRLVVGIGGSATNDGGMGLLRALGARFYAPGGEITAPGDLVNLERADFSAFDARIGECEIVLASDVKNPLCGPDGASAVYGPQKGASPEDVEHMDRCLRRLAEAVAAQPEMHGGDALSPGAGAAGGLGWALMQCCGAVMRPGIDVVLDAARFEEALEGAGLVITGEGRLDAQTAMGKAPAGVAKRAARLGVPVAAIAGALGEGHEAVYAAGIDCAAGIAPGPMALEEAMDRAEELIEKAAARLARTIGAGMRIGGKGA
jgi:glycerate kinase